MSPQDILEDPGSLRAIIYAMVKHAGGRVVVPATTVSAEMQANDRNGAGVLIYEVDYETSSIIMSIRAPGAPLQS